MQTSDFHFFLRIIINLSFLFVVVLLTTINLFPWK